MLHGDCYFAEDSSRVTLGTRWVTFGQVLFCTTDLVFYCQYCWKCEQSVAAWIILLGSNVAAHLCYEPYKDLPQSRNFRWRCKRARSSRCRKEKRMGDDIHWITVWENEKIKGTISNITLFSFLSIFNSLRLKKNHSKQRKYEKNMTKNRRIKTLEMVILFGRKLFKLTIGTDSMFKTKTIGKFSRKTVRLAVHTVLCFFCFFHKIKDKFILFFVHQTA